MSLFQDNICLKNNIKTAEIFIYSDNLSFIGGYPSGNLNLEATELQTFSTLPGVNLIYDIKKTGSSNSLTIQNVSKNFTPISIVSLGKEYQSNCDNPYSNKVKYSSVFNPSSNTITIQETGDIVIGNITLSNLGVSPSGVIGSCSQKLKGTNKNIISELLSKSNNPTSFLLSKLIITYIECI